jgi:DNA-binding XRE family transcriptional regulator
VFKLSPVTDRQILRVIGRNVRESRLKADMTQECLAELVGIHWKTLGRIERGEFPFATTTFAKLTQYLQVSPNRLLDGLAPPDLKRMARISKALSRKRRPRKST